jgi:hypothetical protein
VGRLVTAAAHAADGVTSAVKRKLKDSQWLNDVLS